MCTLHNYTLQEVDTSVSHVTLYVIVLSWSTWWWPVMPKHVVELTLEWTVVMSVRFTLNLIVHYTARFIVLRRFAFVFLWTYFERNNRNFDKSIGYQCSRMFRCLNLRVVLLIGRVSNPEVLQYVAGVPSTRAWRSVCTCSKSYFGVYWFNGQPGFVWSGDYSAP